MTEPPMVGDEFAGYRLRSVLGRGGMSVVYQAENPRLGAVIALKVLAPELATDDVFRARFLEESRIAASLNHPNVIPIYDTGSYGGLLYIAMRYVSGTDLRQMLKKRGRLIPSVTLSLTAQAARALDAAHRRGLVHRDVKPGNLLIERGDDDDDPDHVYLADFGITKHAMDRTGMTASGQFLGTVDYVAPEQIQGMSVLGLADQYSLGCVVYECLTGRVPFEKDLDAAIIWAHVQESPTMATALRPRTLGSLDIAGAAPAGGTQGNIATEAFRPPEVPHELPTGKIPAGAQAASTPRSDTVISRRLQPGGAPPDQAGGPDGGQPARGRPGPRRRWFARPGWIAALTALVLIAVGAGTWALVSGRSGSHPHAASSASAKPTPPSALMAALTLANRSGGAKGLLPPSACKQQSATMVTCTAPAPGISQVTFRTYPSLTAVYAAYTTQVEGLNSGKFQANFQDCGLTQTFGEVSWNHQFQHPKTYSVAQLSSGKLTEDQAAGRVFCTLTNGQESFVWTQNAGNLLAVAAGPVHEDVWNWWVDVHHNIGFAGMPMNM